MSMRNNPDPLDIESLRAQRHRMRNLPQPSMMQLIRADKNRSALVSVWRALSARIGPGKLSWAEYIRYGSGDVSNTDLRLFAGARLKSVLHAVCNDPAWFALTKNKLLFETLMKGAGLPVPETIAAYDRKGRGAGTRIIAGRPALDRFLCETDNYPMFCKPTTGVYSLGALLLDKFENDTLRINGKTRAHVDKVAGFINDVAAKGYLFQKPLGGDAVLAGLLGDKGLVSLRFFVLQDGQNTHIQECVAKLPAKGEVADNFWRDGALLCALNHDNGTITRVVLSHENRVMPVEHHPQSGKQLLGVVLPGFVEARACVKKAAAHFHGVATQSWDVALTRKGSVLLEVNFGGDLDLIQLATNRGILTRNYCAHLRKFGYRGALPF